MPTRTTIVENRTVMLKTSQNRSGFFYYISSRLILSTFFTKKYANFEKSLIIIDADEDIHIVNRVFLIHFFKTGKDFFIFILFDSVHF